ncbi:MAG: Gfo/Idh/MocA family oxidoreductase [Planctomycetota bacterium]
MDKKKAVFGIVGLGNISKSQHLPNLSRAEHIDFKTVCDLSKDLVVQMRKKYNTRQATTDYAEMLADSEIDAVVIGTQPESHVPLTIQAIQAGKHVYVEKPLAETADECHELLKAQKNSGKLVAVGFNRRKAPAYEKAKEILQSHGGPRNIHYRISDPYVIWQPDPEPGVRVIHEVCHVFDILRYLTGSEVKSVYCVSSRPDDETITLQFESGCVATIMASGYVEYDMPKERLEAIVDTGGFFVEDFVELTTFGLRDFDKCYRFRGHVHPDRETLYQDLFAIEGAEAMIALRRILNDSYYSREWEFLKNKTRSAERDRVYHYIHNKSPFVNYMMDKGWLQALDHFAQCIINGTLTELAGPRDGLIVSLITEAVIESRKKGEVVHLDLHAQIGKGFCFG